MLERQYSSNEDNTLKRLLIDKLIQGKYIDGYKTVGASCSDADAFVDIDGNSLRDRKFEIKCRLSEEDTLSYQDSFKWYDYDKDKAYNYEPENYSHELDPTNRNLDGDEDGSEWDGYHQYYCLETSLCYKNGEEIYVDSEHLEDFTWIESRNAYHHDEDCIQCDECHEDIVCEDALSSEITGESYCCDKYMEKAETAFMQENWYYSEYDNKWFEEEEDITHIQVWIDTESRYKDISISTVTLDKLIEDEKAWTFDDETFDKVNPETGLPYGYEPTKKERHEYSIVEETV